MVVVRHEILGFPAPCPGPLTARPGYIGTIGRVARRGETLELAVLGLLHEGPMHGYELRKRLNLMPGGVGSCRTDRSTRR